MKEFITLRRKVIDSNSSHLEIMKISPDDILFMSQQRPTTYTVYCTRLYLVNGKEIFVEEDLETIEGLIKKYYKKKEKDNVDRIVISKDDIVKNFIFKNLV